MTHHTPWQVVKRGTQVIATCDRRSPLTGKDVVMAECQSYDDAAFIARACNAHNDLLATCEAAELAFSAISTSPIRSMLDAAITKARGE